MKFTLGLLSDRTRISLSRPRPKVCEGCPGNPRDPDFDPMRVGSFIPPFGPLDAPLLAIGISGGEEEEERGEPLVGPSGRKLRRAIQWANDGAPLPLRLYNVFNCRSIKVGMRQEIVNRTPPSAAEMRACCERWLLPELKHSKAKSILILGTDAFNFLMSKRFGDFAKAMGHRLVIPRSEVSPKGLGSKILSYGVSYDV